MDILIGFKCLQGKYSRLRIFFLAKIIIFAYNMIHIERDFMKILIIVMEVALHMARRAILSQHLAKKGFLYKHFSLFKTKPLRNILVMFSYILSMQVPICFLIFNEILYRLIKEKIETDIDSLKPYIKPMSEEVKIAYAASLKNLSFDEFIKAINEQSARINKNNRNGLNNSVLNGFETRFVPIAYTLEEVKYLGKCLDLPFTVVNDGEINIAFLGMDEEYDFESFIDGKYRTFKILDFEAAKDATFVVYAPCENEFTDFLIQNIRTMRRNSGICSIGTTTDTFTMEKERKLERTL